MIVFKEKKRKRENRKLKNRRRAVKGAAGLEAMVVVVVLLAIATVAIPLFLNRSTINRDNITHKKILEIKKAIVGDPSIFEGVSRTSFGFLGDVGVLPGITDGLTDLVENTAGMVVYPAWQQEPTTGLWYGWNGPYLDNKVNQDGNFVALLDAWGRTVRYLDLDGNPSTWDAEIRSAGPDGLFDNEDDIYVTISEDEVRTYVSGTFRDRAQNPIEEDGVTVYFPNGTTGWDSVQITKNPGDENPYHQYNSATDTVSDPNSRKIPIGNRYFETQKYEVKKLAALNGGQNSQVSFVIEQVLDLPSTLFERTFRPTDDVPNNQFTDVYIPPGGKTEIVASTQTTAGGGYLTASGTALGWPDDTTIIGFGNNQWDDYRIEANILHGNGHKYQVFYRMNGLGYNPAQPDDDLKISGSGYGFEFDPQSPIDDDYAWGDDNGAGIGKVVLRIWKYRDGLPRAILVEKEYDKAAFLSKFGYYILWRAHQISLTVETAGANIEHHVLINGRDVFDSDVIDADPAMPSSGYAGILVHYHTNFRLHHLLVHKVPPQPDFPYVWWSFEEGLYTVNNHVYGFGYLDDAPVLIGTLTDPVHVFRQWQDDNIHGQAIYVDESGDGHIEFGNVLDFSPTDAFSISAWLKMPSINPANIYTVLSKIKVQGKSETGWELILYKEGSYNFGAVFNLRKKEGSGGGSSRELKILNNLQIQENKWYHIVVVYDGSSYSGHTLIEPSAMRIYVTARDSNNVNPAPQLIVLSQSLYANDQTANNSVMIMGAGVGGSNAFYGHIDEVKFYWKALTNEEIEALFQEDK